MDAVWLNRDRLKALRQNNRPLAQFYSEFEKLCVDAEISDDATKADKFYDGLDPVMQAKLQPDTRDDYQKLVNAAHRLDALRQRFPQEFEWRYQPRQIEAYRPTQAAAARGFYDRARTNRPFMPRSNHDQHIQARQAARPNYHQNSAAASSYRPASRAAFTSLLSHTQGEYLFDSLTASQHIEDLFKLSIAILDTGSCNLCSSSWLLHHQLHSRLEALRCAMTIRTASGTLVAKQKAFLNLQLNDSLVLPVWVLVVDTPMFLPILLGMTCLEQQAAIIDCGNGTLQVAGETIQMERTNSGLRYLYVHRPLPPYATATATNPATSLLSFSTLR